MLPRKGDTVASIQYNIDLYSLLSKHGDSRSCFDLSHSEVSFDLLSHSEVSCFDPRQHFKGGSVAWVRQIYYIVVSRHCSEPVDPTSRRTQSLLKGTCLLVQLYIYI